jgi:hypothetical protein
MKHSFSSLTFAAAILMASPAVAQVTPLAPAGSFDGAITLLSDAERRVGAAVNQGAGPVNPCAHAGLSGQQLVAEAATRVMAEPAVAAELRYKVDAFGHQLIGTGSYLQLGQGAEKLLRLDLKMQVGDRPATLQEIRGEDYYWIRRAVPPSAATLGRVDLRQLRQSLARSAGAATDVMPQGGWIMLGGLPSLLAALDRNFTFAAPRPDELKFTASSGQVEQLPIWIVTGRWKEDRLAALAGGDPAKKGLPEQLPTRVEIVLGRTEQVLPLFPYRITYWRDPQAVGQSNAPSYEGAADAPTAPRELLSLEFFNVSRKGNIDPREFVYSPGDQEVLDLTASYIQRYSETKLR